MSPAKCDVCKRVMDGSGCIGFLEINGKRYERIPNDENGCGDCGAGLGKLHHWMCDMERCPKCGGQVLGCECSSEEGSKYVLMARKMK